MLSSRNKKVKLYIFLYSVKQTVEGKKTEFGLIKNIFFINNFLYILSSNYSNASFKTYFFITFIFSPFQFLNTKVYLKKTFHIFSTIN